MSRVQAREAGAPGERNDSTAGASLRFAPWKNGLSGAGLTRAAAAGVLRTPVNQPRAPPWPFDSAQGTPSAVEG